MVMQESIWGELGVNLLASALFSVGVYILVCHLKSPWHPVELNLLNIYRKHIQRFYKLSFRKARRIVYDRELYGQILHPRRNIPREEILLRIALEREDIPTEADIHYSLFQAITNDVANNPFHRERYEDMMAGTLQLLSLVQPSQSKPCMATGDGVEQNLMGETEIATKGAANVRLRPPESKPLLRALDTRYLMPVLILFAAYLISRKKG